MQVPAAPIENELVIKKSRFIANAAPVADRQAALAWLAQVQQRYPDARHHCWAYVLGTNPASLSAAMSDDGEPSGTAGKPILNVLQHKGVANVMVIVSRYFGGIKLGAGGLVRAYSHVTEMAMQALPLTTLVAMQQCQVELDFALEQPLRHLLAGMQGEVIAVEYQQNVAITCTVPAASLAVLQEFCERQQVLLRLTDLIDQ